MTQYTKRINIKSDIKTIDKEHLNKSYKKTIKQTQQELSPTARIFSKMIHNNIIEKTSDIVGNTIARPNAILFGAFSSFVITLSLYLISKSSGYQLSGSEFIISFVFGWLIGIIFDYLKVMITGKK